MRRILVASLLLLPSLFPAAASASKPADDSSSTPSLRVSSGVTNPVLLNAGDVHIAANVRDRIIPNEATVVLSLNVDENGRPQDVQIVKSVNKMLDERVMEAVRQFHFNPARLNDQPVPVDLTLNVVVKR